MNHSQIQITPSGDRKTTPLSRFAARLVEQPLEEDFHSLILALRVGFEIVLTPLLTPLFRSLPAGRGRPGEVRGRTRAARSAVSPQCGSTRLPETRLSWTQPRRRPFSSRGRPDWSAATLPKKPCVAATACGPCPATSDTRWLDQWGVEKIAGDLEDEQALRRGLAGADWVFNCAAKVGDWGTLEEFRRLNVEALRLLLDAACDAQVERFVHVSSLGVYEGRDHYGTDETVPPAANSLDAYTRSKTEAEALALNYHKERGLPVAVVRPGFIYGERDRTVLPKLLVEPAAGEVRLFRLG